MSELGVPHLTDNVILTAAQWNAALRRSSRELQDLLQHWLFGNAAPSAGGGGVIGGLVVDNVTGQLQVTVSPGTAFFYNAANADPLSKFGLVQLPTAATLSVAAAHATYDRIDVVSIATPTGTDTTETCLVWEAAPGDYDTQRGMQFSVTVTTGTPADPPVAPATPAGHLKLAEVRVAATVTNLDAAVITDSRVLSGGFVPRDGVGNAALRTGGGREWVRAVAGSSGVTVTNTSPSDLSMGIDTTAGGLPFVFDKVDTGAVVGVAAFPIPNDWRSLEAVMAGIHFAVVEQFGGTASILAKLIWAHPDAPGGSVEVAAYTIANIVDGGFHNMVLSEEVDASIGYLYVTVSVTITGTPTAAGKLRIFGATATLREPIPTL